jgi:hypothetical protein
LIQIIFVILLVAGVIILALIGLYWLYKEQVAEPKKLVDVLKEALGGNKADVQAIEPARDEAAAITTAGEKIIMVRKYGHDAEDIKATFKDLKHLSGAEIFVDNKVLARTQRGGAQKMIDEIPRDLAKVSVRLMYDTPADPSFEIIIWSPNDKRTAMAEGPVAAFETARKWFYVVDAYLRKPAPAPVTVVAAPPPSAPEDPTPPPGKKPEVDILNAPLVPYTH